MLLSPVVVGTAEAAPSRFGEMGKSGGGTRPAGHLREKRAGFSWAFPEVCPFFSAPDVSAKESILESPLPTLECSRNTRHK